MCGRYTRMFSWKRLHQLYNIHNLTQLELQDLRASFNVAPTQLAPVVRGDEAGRRAEWMRWGLTPSWSKDGAPGPINAKGETVATNGLFRAAFARRRCVVPVSGFYEWHAGPGGKSPHYIHPAQEDGVLSLAGLWEFWRRDESSEPIISFTILTTTPNEMMARLHDRMPVILPPEGVERWLDPAARTEDLQGLIAPSSAADLMEHRVSRAVNSPARDGPELIETVSPGGVPPSPGPAAAPRKPSRRAGPADDGPTLFG